MYELRTSSVVHLLTVFRPDRWFRRSAPRRKKASIPPVRVQPLVAQLNRVLLTSTQVVFVASVAVGDTNVVAVGFHPIDRIVYVWSHYLEMSSMKRFRTQVYNVYKLFLTCLRSPWVDSVQCSTPPPLPHLQFTKFYLCQPQKHIMNH